MAISKRIRNGVGMLGDLPSFATPSDGKLTEQQVAYILDGVRALIAAVNGRISFGDGSQSSQSGNIDGQTKQVFFETADVDYEVPHGLGRVPIGIIQLDVDQSGAVVYGGNRGSWSPTRMAVRCNVPSTNALFVVV